MIFLTGSTWGKSLDRIREAGWGRMWVRDSFWPYEGETWGLDNGVYAAYLKGEGFDEGRYLKTLERAMERPDPYLAILPDKVAKGLESLDFSAAWIDRVPDHWPWYIALQDGMETTDVDHHIHHRHITGLFLGGSDRLKIQAQKWKDYAHANNLKFHYGRAGTRYKLGHALRVGSDSADSAFPLWTIERFQQTADLLANPKQATTLPLWSATLEVIFHDEGGLYPAPG